MKWIKTSEQLPEDSREVLANIKVTYDYAKSIVFAKRSEGRWLIFTGTHFNFPMQDSEVFYWMPYPDLPEEEIPE